MKPINIGILVGSLRAASMSRRIANALPALAPASFQFREISFRDLPLLDDDLQATPPAAWTTFRDAVRASDALIFITPEYNRSIPGGLKNAIDVASKPPGQNCWGGKPAAVMAQSSGPLGGLAAAYALRQALAAVNMATLAHPEIHMGNVAKLFDEQGQLVPATQDFLRAFLLKYEEWVARFIAR